MKALIIDDETYPGKFLKNLVEENCPQFKTVDYLSSPREAIKYINRESPDLIYLDIEMPEMNGFEMLELLAPDRIPLIIFVTAYDKFAIQAFKVNAIDYILKPVDVDDLVRATQKAENRISNRESNEISPVLPYKNKLSLFDGKQYSFHDIQEIIRLESDGSYTSISMEDGRKITVCKNLKHFEQLLENRGFVRCHRSHMINMNHLSKYNKFESSVVLSNQDVVNVSVANKDKFNNII